MTTLPVRSHRRRELAEGPYTRRAGWMVGTVMFLSMLIATWGMGWVGLASAMVPILVGAGAAGTAERSRRWSDKAGNPAPMALGGAWLGAISGFMLAPFWGMTAQALGVTGAVPMTPDLFVHLMAAGAAMGGMAGATTGLAVGVARHKGDPIGAGAVAGGAAALLTAGGVATGAFAGVAGVFGSWLGANPAAFSQMLAYAPGFLGALGMGAVAGTAAFAGTLTVKGAEAREKRLALPDPDSFPEWARADSVTRYRRKEDRPIYIG